MLLGREKNNRWEEKAEGGSQNAEGRMQKVK
jgi:hypothetical protein